MVLVNEASYCSIVPFQYYVLFLLYKQLMNDYCLCVSGRMKLDISLLTITSTNINENTLSNLISWWNIFWILSRPREFWMQLFSLWSHQSISISLSLLFPRKNLYVAKNWSTCLCYWGIFTTLLVFILWQGFYHVLSHVLSAIMKCLLAEARWP